MGDLALGCGDAGLTPGSGRSPGVGNGNPLQYSCLENPMDIGAWQIHGVTESDTTEHYPHMEKRGITDFPDK